jgi:hypothetical protein
MLSLSKMRFGTVFDGICHGHGSFQKNKIAMVFFNSCHFEMVFIQISLLAVCPELEIFSSMRPLTA